MLAQLRPAFNGQNLQSLCRSIIEDVPGAFSLCFAIVIYGVRCWGRGWGRGEKSNVDRLLIGFGWIHALTTNIPPHKNTKHAAPLCPKRFSPPLSSLILRMLDKRREARPTMEEVLSHPVFAHYPHFPPASQVLFVQNYPQQLVRMLGCLIVCVGCVWAHSLTDQPPSNI